MTTTDETAPGDSRHRIVVVVVVVGGGGGLGLATRLGEKLG